MQPGEDVSLTEAKLEELLEAAAERGASAVLHKLGCPTDAAEAIQWLADVQQGVKAVGGVRSWLTSTVKQLATNIFFAIVALALIGVAIKSGYTITKE
jgi:hypothetical protein